MKVCPSSQKSFEQPTASADAAPTTTTAPTAEVEDLEIDGLKVSEAVDEKAALVLQPSVAEITVAKQA